MSYVHRGLLQPQHGAPPDRFIELLDALRVEWDEMKRRGASEYEQQRENIRMSIPATWFPTSN